MSHNRSLRKTGIGNRVFGPGGLAKLQATQKLPAGGMVDAVPPSQDAVRAAIGEGKCPFCGKGPYKMLPVHTNKIHGVDKWELRDLAGLSATESLCLPEALEKMSVKAKAHWPEVKDRLAQAAPKATAGRTRAKGTKAGRARNTETLRQWRIEHPEEAALVRRRATAATSAPEAQAKRIASLRANGGFDHKRTPEAKAAFVARMQSPESRTKRAIARPIPEHGTNNRYKRGCRCEPCRSARSVYRKEHP